MNEIALRLGQIVSRTLHLLGHRPRPVHSTPTREEPADADLVLLNRILTVVARRPGQREDFRLLSDQMSTDCIVFKTSSQVRLGDELSIQLLTHHGHVLALPATVNWVMNVENGLAGQLDIKTTPEQRDELRVFLREATTRL